jgi:hypothetical protein
VTVTARTNNNNIIKKLLLIARINKPVIIINKTVQIASNSVYSL